MKQELIRVVRAAGFTAPTTESALDRNGATQSLSLHEIALLKAVLTAGLYDNIGKIMYMKSVDITEKLACIVETAQGKAQVHPSSVNRDLQTYGWLLYQEKVSENSKCNCKSHSVLLILSNIDQYKVQLSIFILSVFSVR